MENFLCSGVRFRPVMLGAIATLTSLLLIGLEIAPAFAQSAGLTNISPAVFACMRRNTRGLAGWIVYDGENQGRIRVFATGIGQVGELSYSFNPSQQTLNVSYVRGQVPFNQVRNGFVDTANKCRSGEYR